MPNTSNLAENTPLIADFLEMSLVSNKFHTFTLQMLLNLSDDVTLQGDEIKHVLQKAIFLVTISVHFKPHRAEVFGTLL